jgi:ABC-type nitrate/sulfonate/bicarbonate transport system substrate-binding protein
MTAGWFAEKSWIDKHREVAVQFAAAIREATLWANANRPATEPLLVEALKLPADLIHSLTLPANYGETLRAADIQPMLNGAVKYGALGTPIRADDLIAKLK